MESILRQLQLTGFIKDYEVNDDGGFTFHSMGSETDDCDPIHQMVEQTLTNAGFETIWNDCEDYFNEGQVE